MDGAVDATVGGAANEAVDDWKDIAADIAAAGVAVEAAEGAACDAADQ